VPVRLDIPGIGVHTSLMELGLAGDGTVEVPPFTKDAPAGWYDGSPAPGQAGPAVILGHVHAGTSEGVFSRLSELTPGARIEVGRADGSSAVFTVTSLATYAKEAFPAQAVYGDTTDPQLRLITCGGYDRQTRTYRDNVVVYAAMRRA
jgi:sortase (surface protein transpeptidase)